MVIILRVIKFSNELTFYNIYFENRSFSFVLYNMLRVFRDFHEGLGTLGGGQS